MCRISTIQQDKESLKDQEALYRRWLDDNADHPFEIIVLASQGSGEHLERGDYLRAIALVGEGNVDLVLTEDIGRICRRVQAFLFAELCEDMDTRLIAINDHIDTFREDWQLNSFFAVMRHESYNRDGAARIRRSQRNRFLQGGLLQFVIFGYVKPAGAKTDDELKKDPHAEAIYEEWFRRLDQGASYAEISDWLNEQGIPPGPYSRTKKWTGTMVGRVTHNPILKGIRFHNAKMSRRVNSTGRRKAVKAPPEERIERQCPHLAFFEPEYYDRVIRKVDARNARCRRRGKDGRDCRSGVPRKRTTWPGQHLRCGVCGRLYYWTGLGERKMMKCSGSHEYLCWNAVEVNGSLVARKLSQAILKEVMELPGFDEALHEKVKLQWQQAHSQSDLDRKKLVAQMEMVQRQTQRIADAIADTGGVPSLFDKLKSLEAEKSAILLRLDRLHAEEPTQPVMPDLDRIQSAASALLHEFVPQDPEVSRLMHVLLPDLKVFPYQLCDGGHVVLRAHFTLRLVALTNGDMHLDVPEIQRPMVVDLFDPPQRVQFREQVAKLRAKGLTERQVAGTLGITQPAVQRASALTRLMEAKGLQDPFVLLREPPQSGHIRRHQHPRYRFEPLTDTQPPQNWE